MDKQEQDKGSVIMTKKMKKVSIKASVLTAIGYLLPLVVASGLLIAIFIKLIIL